MVFTIQDRNVAAVPGTQSKIHTTDLAILLAGYSGTGVVSGCGVTAQGSPDMTVAVAAGVILAAGVQVAVTSGNLTVGTADGTNPRIDLISASAAGVKTITAGTAAPVATCKPPDLPSGHIGLAFIDVPAADTTIGAAQITDKRVVLNVDATTVDFTLAGDVTMTTNGTSYDGPSGLFAAGTWAISWKVLIVNGAGGIASYFVKLWDGTTIYDESETSVIANSGYRTMLSGFAPAVVLATATTLKLTAKGDSASNGAKMSRDGGNGTTHTVTRLSGIKIA